LKAFLVVDVDVSLVTVAITITKWRKAEWAASIFYWIVIIISTSTESTSGISLWTTRENYDQHKTGKSTYK